MTKDVQIKQESKDFDTNQSNEKIQPENNTSRLTRFDCQFCEISFCNEETRNIHQRNFCYKREKDESVRLDPSDKSSVKCKKRKRHDFTRTVETSTKPMSLLADLPSTNRWIYLPIGIRAPGIDRQSTIDGGPLDFSLTKKIKLHSDCRVTPLDLTAEKFSKPSQQKLFPCQFCSIRFQSLETLDAHQKNYCIEYQARMNQYQVEHDRLIKQIDKQRSQSSSQTFSKNSKLHSKLSSSLFTCRLCDYQCNSLINMQSHLKFHLSLNQMCSNEDIIVNPTANSLPVSLNTELLLKCFICSAMFDSFEPLLHHISSVHSNEDELECLACQSKFSSVWNLHQHLTRSHTNMKFDDEESKQDSKYFSRTRENNNNNLIVNDPIRTSSFKYKRFSCPYCFIRFGSFDTLKQHMTNYCSLRPSIDLSFTSDQRTSLSTQTIASNSQHSSLVQHLQNRRLANDLPKFKKYR